MDAAPRDGIGHKVTRAGQHTFVQRFEEGLPIALLIRLSSRHRSDVRDWSVINFDEVRAVQNNC